MSLAFSEQRHTIPPHVEGIDVTGGRARERFTAPSSGMRASLQFRVLAKTIIANLLARKECPLRSSMSVAENRLDHHNADSHSLIPW
jgi:hypothetical protein